MLLDDAVADAEPQACTFADRLRSVEGIEGAIHVSKTRAAVFDFDDGAAMTLEGANRNLFQRAAAFDGVNGIVHQVEQNLLELVLVHGYPRQVWFDVGCEIYVMRAQVVLA